MLLRKNILQYFLLLFFEPLILDLEYLTTEK